MAQVDVNYSRIRDLIWSRGKTQLVVNTVVLRIYRKSKLDPKEVTVINRWAGWRSRSGYLTEVVVSLDYEDYPFLPKDFNTPLAVEACRSRAEMIWVGLRARFHRPLLVWVRAGHMSGYYDGLPED